MKTSTVTASMLLSTAMLYGCASEVATSTAPRAETKAAERDLATMKASQLFDQRARAAASPQVRDQFIAVLAEKSVPDDVQGFECAVLQAMLISQRDDKPIDPMPLLKRSAAQEGHQRACVGGRGRAVATRDVGEVGLDALVFGWVAVIIGAG